MTCCHLPTQIYRGFGTASSNRLEVDWLQPKLELHITFRTCIIVLTASALGGKKTLGSTAWQPRGCHRRPTGLSSFTAALALSNACYFRLSNQNFN